MNNVAADILVSSPTGLLHERTGQALPPDGLAWRVPGPSLPGR
ncbi:MAG TPA: hypothetical protein VIL08_00065 [Limnochorda sp.]